jgi:hypothetical protein
MSALAANGASTESPPPWINGRAGHLGLVLAIIAALLYGALQCGSCVSTQQAAQQLDAMSEPDFEAFKRDVAAHVEIGIGLALDRQAIDADDQLAIAKVLDTLAGGTVSLGDIEPLATALADAGLRQNEIRAVFLLVEDALRRAGVRFSVPMTARCAEVLRAVSEAVLIAQPSPTRGE